MIVSVDLHSSRIRSFFALIQTGPRLIFIFYSVLLWQLKIFKGKKKKKKNKRIDEQFWNKTRGLISLDLIILPSTISCFIFWNSLRTSLMISALNASISWAVSTAPSLTPFTFRSVSSEAEPNLLRTDFGDSAPFENLLLDKLFLSHDFLSGELSGSYGKGRKKYCKLKIDSNIFEYWKGILWLKETYLRLFRLFFLNSSSSTS